MAYTMLMHIKTHQNIVNFVVVLMFAKNTVEYL